MENLKTFDKIWQSVFLIPNFPPFNFHITSALGSRFFSFQLSTWTGTYLFEKFLMSDKKHNLLFTYLSSDQINSHWWTSNIITFNASMISLIIPCKTNTWSTSLMFFHDYLFRLFIFFKWSISCNILLIYREWSLHDLKFPKFQWKKCIQFTINLREKYFRMWSLTFCNSKNRRKKSVCFSWEDSGELV